MYVFNSDVNYHDHYKYDHRHLLTGHSKMHVTTVTSLTFSIQQNTHGDQSLVYA